MKNSIAIRREDLNKKGEKRVAVIPELAKTIIEAGHNLRVQSQKHPETNENKRAFSDSAYADLGATITEDIAGARVVIGLKEVKTEYIAPNTTYLCFSHTHKAQIKNREMLRTFKDRKTTLIDYELMVNADKARVITAFTYFAGYAGMIDTLWTAGQRYALAGQLHPFAAIPQSIETEDLNIIKKLIQDIGTHISENGTPDDLPPFINVILGQGKTSTGAQEIYDILPVENITLAQIPEIYANGDRKKVYKCVLGITEMFRLKAAASLPAHTYAALTIPQKESHYFQHPSDFESNLQAILPYASILMNCILWAPQFPRLLSRTFTKAQWEQHQTLIAIGDITCDPEGSIEFSQETWIDDPVFIYNPATNTSTLSMEGQGIAVMAVTNLPCEFSADASTEFSANLSPYLPGIIAANYEASLENSQLPEAIQKAVILWNGEFTPRYAYMQDYL
ncbi:MAG TPA: hypothetical protein ENJ82_06070 [Bacteroidetes bacterium]|nr:hypothetical protein [Bacteroidota bacterium]